MENQKDIQKIMKDAANKFFLAGLGAFSFVGEKSSRLFNDLIEKGKDFESKSKEGKQGAVHDKLLDMKTKVEKYGETLETVVDQRLKKVIEKIGLPSREEISSLSKRVETLMANVESILRKQRQKKEPMNNSSSKDATGS